MMKSQKEKVLNSLMTYGTGTPGVTIRRLADRAGLDVIAVQRRVYDLRSEGYEIYTNTRTVNGKRHNYYRIAV